MDRLPASARLKPGGLVIAGAGFLLTRYAVATTLRMEFGTVPFLVGQAPFLLLGLGLSVFGVALTVSSRRTEYVRTVTLWCLLGLGSIGAILVLVRAESMLASLAGGMAPGLVPRLLLGGAVGGTLTGRYAAQGIEQRQLLRNRTDRLTVLNRLLRHEVLNKVTVIRGYADLDHEEGAERIQRNADRIDEVINQVGLLAGADDPTAVVDLSRIAEEAVAAASTRHPEATFECTVEDSVHAVATRRLDTILEHLLDNAVEHNDGDTPHVVVSVRTHGATAKVVISDDGPGLPAEQRAVLVSGDLPRFDDPTAGFGLAITSLLIDESDASVSVEEDDGTTVTLQFARAVDGTAGGVAAPTLVAAAGASLVAGVVMGLLLAVTVGTIPIIGALYGAANAVVGWLTHLFHSVIFGLGFAAAVTHPQFRPSLGSTLSCILAGVAYGTLLAVVAAGIVMPLWLQGLGYMSPFPNVTLIGLASHVVWGGIVGGLFPLFQRVAKRLEDR